jgi:hypothetical protein
MSRKLRSWTPSYNSEALRLLQKLVADRRYYQWRRRYPVSSLILITFEKVKMPLGILIGYLVLYAIVTSPAAH